MDAKFVGTWEKYWSTIPQGKEEEIEFYYLSPIKHCLGKLPHQELTDSDLEKITFIWYRELRTVIGTAVQKWAYVYRTESTAPVIINNSNNCVVNAPNVHDYEEKYRGLEAPYEFIGRCRNLVELDMLNNYFLDKLVRCLGLDEESDLFSYFPRLEKLNDRDHTRYPSRRKNMLYVVVTKKDYDNTNLIVRDKKEEAIQLAKKVVQDLDYDLSNVIIYEVNRETDRAMRMWQWIAEG